MMAEPRKETAPRRSRARATSAKPQDGRVREVVHEEAPVDEPREGAEARTTTVRLPVFTVAVTRHAVPAASATGSGSGTRTAGTPTSRAGKLAFYGGIAALGALEVVEWPVAVALGAGVYVLRRMRPAAPAPGADDRQPQSSVGASSGE
jgi:hypothetical protein